MTADIASKSSSALLRLCRKLKMSPTSSTKEKEAATADHDHSKPSLSNPTETGNPPQDHYLWKVFDYFDQNGDRKISPAELQTCVTSVGGSLSSEEAEAAVEACDLDGDGLLGFQEFQKLMMEVPPNDKNRELRDAFRMYEEREGSDSITPSSLKRMLSRLGQSRSIDDCKAIIRTFDLNGDGLLSFHEFTIMMR